MSAIHEIADFGDTKFVQITFSTDRDEAIKAGFDWYGERTVTVRPSELTPQQREAVLAFKSFPVGQENTGFRPRRFAVFNDENVLAALDDAATILRLRREKEEAEKRESEQEIETFLNELTPEMLIEEPPYRTFGSRLSIKTPSRAMAMGSRRSFVRDMPFIEKAYLVKDHPRWVAVLEEARRIVDLENKRLERQDEETKARNQELEAERNRKAQEVLERRSRQIETWFQEHGTANQKLRHERGMLPEQEILDSMREAYLRPLDGFEKFKKLTRDEVSMNLMRRGLYEGGAIRFVSRDEVHLSAEQFEHLIAIEDAAKELPGKVKVTPQVHIGYVADKDGNDDPDVRRWSARVEMTLGELTFSRLYALPDRELATNDA